MLCYTWIFYAGFIQIDMEKSRFICNLEPSLGRLTMGCDQWLRPVVTKILSKQLRR